MQTVNDLNQTLDKFIQNNTASMKILLALVVLFILYQFWVKYKEGFGPGHTARNQVVSLSGSEAMVGEQPASNCDATDAKISENGAWNWMIDQVKQDGTETLHSGLKTDNELSAIMQGY